MWRSATRSVCTACFQKQLALRPQACAGQAVTFPWSNQARKQPFFKFKRSVASVPMPSTIDNNHTQLRNVIKKKMENLLDVSVTRNLNGNVTLSNMQRYIEELKSQQVPLDAEIYEYLLSAYAKLGRADQISRLIAEMRYASIVPSLPFYNKAMQLAGREGNATVQARILTHMAYDGYTPTSKTYQYMLLCMLNNTELERALDTLEMMEQKKITVSLTTLINLLDMAVHYNHPDIAFDILQKAEKDDAFNGLERNLYIHVLRCAARNNSLNIVEACWKAVCQSKDRPDYGLCQHVLFVAGHWGNTQLASDVIRTIGEMGFPYSETQFTSLIEAFMHKMDIKSAFRIFAVMRQAGITPTRLSALPIAYRLGKDVNAVKQARRALEELQVDEGITDVVALNVVIHAFAYNNQLDDALDTFYMAEKLNIERDISTVEAVLDACIHAKQAATGVSIFETYTKAKGLEPTVKTLSKMMTLMCTQEVYDDAFYYIEEMKARGLVPLRGNYYNLVKKLAANNDPRLDMALEEMNACGYETSTHLSQYLETRQMNQEQEQEQSRTPRRRRFGRPPN